MSAEQAIAAGAASQPRSYTTPDAIHRLMAEHLRGLSEARQAAAMALTNFVGRFHSLPARVDDPFCLAREAIAGHPLLGLTEKQVRVARDDLEGALLQRVPEEGSGYGGVDHQGNARPARWRRATLFRFSAPARMIFDWINRRAKARAEAEAARERVKAQREAAQEARARIDPSKRSAVHSGPHQDRPDPNAVPAEVRSRLEAALERLNGCRRGVGGSEPDSEAEL